MKNRWLDWKGLVEIYRTDTMGTITVYQMVKASRFKPKRKHCSQKAAQRQITEAAHITSETTAFRIPEQWT